MNDSQPQQETWAVVTVMGTSLVKVRATYPTQTAAQNEKLKFPHPFGTHVYPCKASTLPGHELTRKPEFEDASS